MITLRILAVSDVHGTQAGFIAVREMAARHGPDLIVVAGDITHFGPAEWARSFMESLPVRALAVNGNCDTPDVAVFLANSDSGLMNRTAEIGGVRILGAAYPFDPAVLRQTGKFEILVSHVPPLGCNDSVPGKHIGDPALRAFVLEHEPVLVISGHVHEARGICELGETVCVNPGPAKDGYGAVVDMQEGDVRAALVDVPTGATTKL